jgi:hypothetical protein
MEIVMKSKSGTSNGTIPAMILKSAVDEVHMSASASQASPLLLAIAVPKIMPSNSSVGKDLEFIMETENDGEDVTACMKNKSSISIEPDTLRYVTLLK